MKKYLCFCCVFLLLLSMCVPCLTSLANETLAIESKSVILIEANSGKVLYEKNADEQLKPASVTKIMTLLLIFEEIENGTISLEDMVTVSEHAASMGGSQCFFEAGEQQTVKDMIKCIEVASGNDAAVAMAEFISGTEEAFVNKMNEKAALLGMNNTHFENACGLEAEGHLTSARDISIMSRELLVSFPEIKEYSTIWMDYIIHKTKRGEERFDLANTNKFLNQYTGATGLKTGYTSQAKYCISASASRNGVDLIAVIMGADTKEIRNKEAAKLLDYGFASCVCYNDNCVLDEKVFVDIKDGVAKKVEVTCEPKHSFVMDKENVDKIEKKINIYKDMEAPIREGDILGVVQYSLNSNVISEVYLYAKNDVKKKTFSLTTSSVIERFFMVK